MGRDIMSHLRLLVNFKRNIIKWIGTVVLMKYIGLVTGKSNIDKIKMREVFIHTIETEYTACVINILNSNYDNTYLKEVKSSATHAKTK